MNTISYVTFATEMIVRQILFILELNIERSGPNVVQKVTLLFTNTESNTLTEHAHKAWDIS